MTRFTSSPVSSMATFKLCAGVLAFAVSRVLLAQNADEVNVCLQMVTSAAHNLAISTQGGAYAAAAYGTYCREDGSVNQSSSKLGFSAIIDSLPFNLSAGNSNSASAQSKFCSDYYNMVHNSTVNNYLQQTVVQDTLRSANQCLEIANQGKGTVSYTSAGPSLLAITVRVNSGEQIHIRGVTPDSRSVRCYGDKLHGDGTVDYGPGRGLTVDSDHGPSYTFSCARQLHLEKNGASFTDDAAIVVDTDAGPLNIEWRGSQYPAPESTADIDRHLSSLESEEKTLQTALEDETRHESNALQQVKLECYTKRVGTPHQMTNGLTVTCDPGYVVTGCGAGNGGATEIFLPAADPNSCASSSTDWNMAICCKVARPPAH